jgi:hypothetical protein
MEDKPDKNAFSHIHDANQYADSVIDMNVRGVAMASSQRREVRPASYRYT